MNSICVLSPTQEDQFWRDRVSRCREHGHISKKYAEALRARHGKAVRWLNPVKPKQLVILPHDLRRLVNASEPVTCVLTEHDRGHFDCCTHAHISRSEARQRTCASPDTPYGAAIAENLDGEHGQIRVLSDYTWAVVGQSARNKGASATNGFNGPGNPRYALISR